MVFWQPGAEPLGATAWGVTPRRETLAPQPVGDRLERWRDMVARSPVPAEVRPPFAERVERARQDFHATVDVAALGDLLFAHGRVGPHHQVRTPELINAAERHYYSVQLRLVGVCELGVEGRREILRPGAMVLLSSRQRFQMFNPTDNQALFVHFPISALSVPADTVNQACGVPLTTDSGVPNLLRGMLLNLGRQLHSEQEPLPARLSGAVLDLVETVLLEQVGGLPTERGRARQALLARVQQDIEAHLGSDRMSPDEIAARNHISKRTLHKLWQDEQLSVSAWVRERRLLRCARDLRDPMQAAVPVAAVAARWGLTDPAYFSHAFRARFGTTPRDYRRGHLNAAIGDGPASGR